MYTRCPQCKTTFTVSQAQLEERDGLVRCGHCAGVFRATDELVSALDGAEGGSAARPRAKTGTGKRPPAPRPKAAGTGPDGGGEPALPTPAELLLGRKPGPRTRNLFWGLASLLLLAGLLAQFVFFYHDALARKAALRPYVIQACRWLACELNPLQDVALIELADTAVAPHKKYANALRIQATLINRAPYSQPFPFMEVSIADRRGAVLARRLFAPAQYLPKESKTLLPPNVAVRARLDLTSPAPQAEGYEIRLVAPPAPENASR